MMAFFNRKHLEVYDFDERARGEKKRQWMDRLRIGAGLVLVGGISFVLVWMIESSYGPDGSNQKLWYAFWESSPEARQARADSTPKAMRQYLVEEVGDEEAVQIEQNLLQIYRPDIEFALKNSMGDEYDPAFLPRQEEEGMVEYYTRLEDSMKPDHFQKFRERAQERGAELFGDKTTEDGVKEFKKERDSGGGKK